MPWKHTNTWIHCLHTHSDSDAHCYISINTVSSHSPCDMLRIASFSLFCWIPLVSYHWRIPLEVKNTVLSCLVPFLAFPIPWFKNSSGLNIPLCLGKDSADTVSVPHTLSQQVVVHRLKCIVSTHQSVSQDITEMSTNMEGCCTSWCELRFEQW